jgi:hypothetical protein
VSWLDCGLEVQGLIPGRLRIFSLCHCIQTGSGAHPTSCPLDARDSFHREWSWPPPSSAEVNVWRCTSTPPCIFMAWCLTFNRLMFWLCTTTCSSWQTERIYYVPMHPWCFKFFSHYVEIFSHSLVIILPEASKIAMNLFLIKICTSEWLVCLVLFLWHFEKIVNSWHTYDFLSIAVFFFFCGGPENEKLGKMSLKTSRLIS